MAAVHGIGGRDWCGVVHDGTALVCGDRFGSMGGVGRDVRRNRWSRIGCGLAGFADYFQNTVVRVIAGLVFCLDMDFGCHASRLREHVWAKTVRSKTLSMATASVAMAPVPKIKLRQTTSVIAD